MYAHFIEKKRRRTCFRLKPMDDFLEAADAITWSKAIEVLIVRLGFNYEIGERR